MTLNANMATYADGKIYAQLCIPGQHECRVGCHCWFGVCAC